MKKRSDISIISLAREHNFWIEEILVFLVRDATCVCVWRRLGSRFTRVQSLFRRSMRLSFLFFLFSIGFYQIGFGVCECVCVWVCNVWEYQNYCLFVYLFYAGLNTFTGTIYLKNQIRSEKRKEEKAKNW